MSHGIDDAVLPKLPGQNIFFIKPRVDPAGGFQTLAEFTNNEFIFLGVTKKWDQFILCEIGIPQTVLRHDDGSVLCSF